MARKNKTEKLNVDNTAWPKVTQGNHSTIIEHKDGKFEMTWDWNKLNEEINNAIREYGLRQSSQAIVGDTSKKAGRKTRTKKGSKNELV